MYAESCKRNCAHNYGRAYIHLNKHVGNCVHAYVHNYAVCACVNNSAICACVHVYS
jgi:hypothetical protein